MEEKSELCGKCSKPKGTKQEGECRCGRPSKYEERFCDSVDEYLKEHKDEFYDWVKTDGDKSTTRERKITVRLPTIEGFSRYIDVPKKTVYEWAKEYPQFRYSLDKIVIEQQERLLDSGLSGDYNSTIAKLILSSNHGMRERTDVTSDDKPIPILGNVQNNDSHKEDSGTDQKNPSSSRGDVSKQDDLDSLIPD